MAEHDRPARRVDDEGGESVCWLHLVCPACGAIAEVEPPPDRCARCGAELEPS